ncbi:hypothetical protein ACFVX6_40500 [Streptomyces sp. NPDC058289]|uniref:hypothetical protein n=1 Tax=Streptomyces sp. NPDC058289 TaxID=3346425 RepID=UPI0036EA7472
MSDTTPDLSPFTMIGGQIDGNRVTGFGEDTPTMSGGNISARGGDDFIILDEPAAE